MTDFVIDAAFYLLIAGAILAVPLGILIMWAMHLSDREADKYFIGPTHMKCGVCGDVFPISRLEEHVQFHLSEMKSSG